MVAKFRQGQLTAMALAALLVVWGTPAAALSLGRISVQSALGEPLKAEIDVLDISAQEASSLVTKVASPEAFQAAGFDYNPALSSLRASLQRREDGRAFLRISSDRVIGEPFVDMILETNWESGRIVRSYTLLFDPPNLRAHTGAALATAQLPNPVPEQITPSPQVVQFVPPAQAPAPTPMARKPVAVAQTIKVAPGDTAGALAASLKPTNVSVDQMLVALLRANPDAFMQDNVNRLKAGAVVTLSSPDQASATPRLEATEIITAQNQAFDNNRRSVAANVPTVKVAPASQDVGGRLEATVDNNQRTLSSDAVQGKFDDVPTQAGTTQASEERTAQLTKNINDPGQSAAADSAADPATVEPASDLAANASESEAASQIADQASVPVPPAAAIEPKKPALLPFTPEPVAEPSFIDALMDNPMLPAGAAALIALLAGLALYRASQRKKPEPPDSSFVNSDPAFSGTSGGRSVNTTDSLSSGSSMVYSPGQGDAVDDVDTVAEADVYLAYGRDLQAEEILKDALRNNPQRVAIHQKLLDIYFKRRDVKAFESVATMAFNLTNGTGIEWEQICQKGIALDPDNALYLPGGQPQASPLPNFEKTEPAVSPTSSSELAVDLALREATLATSLGELDLDLDLDLNFSVGDAASDSAPPAAPARSDAGPTAFFDLDAVDTTPLPTLPTALSLRPEGSSKEPADADNDSMTSFDLLDQNLDFHAPSVPTALDFPATDLGEEPAATDGAPRPGAFPAGELMSFDLDSWSLDLGADKATVPVNFSDDALDPLETKLALAEEFRAIGDDVGARALIEEVIADASGDLRAKAQSALKKL